MSFSATRSSPINFRRLPRLLKASATFGSSSMTQLLSESATFLSFERSFATTRLLNALIKLCV